MAAVLGTTASTSAGAGGSTDSTAPITSGCSTQSPITFTTANSTTCRRRLPAVARKVKPRLSTKLQAVPAVVETRFAGTVATPSSDSPV